MHLILVSSNNHSNTKEQFFSYQFSPFFITVGIVFGVIFSIAFVAYYWRNSAKQSDRQNLSVTDIRWNEFEQSSNVVHLEFLTSTEILNWFYSKKSIQDANENIIAFTVAGSVEFRRFKPDLYDSTEGKYNLIQGFYNELTGELLEYRIILSEDMDNDLKRDHQDGEINRYK